MVFTEEIFLENGTLADQQQWASRISQLKEFVKKDTLLGTLDEQQAQWINVFEQAVLDRARDHQHKHPGKTIGLFFSGGVDSTLIGFVLAKHKIPFIAYTVGFQDEGTKEPEDIVEAIKIAQHYRWQHKKCVLTLDEMEKIVQETIQMLGKELSNPITVGVGAVEVAAAQLAAKDGITYFFGGLGSEEIFAGYERHEKAADVDAECWNGLLLMRERDLLRDCAIAHALGLTFYTPFLDEEVVVLALQLPPALRIKDGHKKYVLREMAVSIGLEKEYAFRPKRAAQYGSRVDSALEKLAKRKGLGKKEYVECFS